MDPKDTTVVLAQGFKIAQGLSLPEDAEGVRRARNRGCVLCTVSGQLQKESRIGSSF